ncbi:MAG: thioredoxin domain-containing protein, partial [Rhodothermaceae bacterium]|nr:thioredoxin domain-containing protein [Rhodothermaceae bacterium]
MPNRLSEELSPYLLQHQNNPVDWYPWGEEAFEKARDENKPVFLSIGYATCHWCHVMEHESFEDNEVATLLNEVFVAVKVDREERPDIDQVYMTYCQLSTGHGGWPLTIIMTPDKEPFFAGTYIPKYSRHGRVGMMDLIPRVQGIWDSRRQEVLDSAKQNTEILNKASEWTVDTSVPGKAVLDHAFRQLSENFDDLHGGFGTAPKFPSPHQLLFLIDHYQATGESSALEMVKKTLQKMRLGGMFDHVGFGFHRYSTDAQWLLPHFEKMLYDQAMIALAAIETYYVTTDSIYKEIADRIFDYVFRDMTAPEGAFYSAEDADSEGVEGKFYVWSESEIEALLPADEASLVKSHYNFEQRGNFVD